MIFFIFSCRVPRLGWRHLRWNRRSPYRTCSLPGCCTFQSQPYWRWWWWNWQTCLTQTSECSDRPKPSHVHSSAKWPLVQGHPRYCRSSSKPMREKGRDRRNDTVVAVVFVGKLSVELCRNVIFKPCGEPCTVPCPLGWSQHQADHLPHEHDLRKTHYKYPLIPPFKRYN